MLLALYGGVLAQSASAAPAGTTHYPDLQTVIPANSFSIVQGPGGREFRYTHLVYNSGPGPLALQPQYNQASGNYQGRQQLFTHDAGGSWSMVQQIRVPDIFFWHAAHGHFHFPLASFGLYSVAQDGGVGAPVAISPKNGFCIDDSYIYDPSVPHAGVAFHSRGGCGDPSSTRGLTVGAADEYDYRDPGQAIPFDGVPDGAYWFRAVSDPNNDVVELDESNNSTLVKVTVANGQVTEGQTTHPDTTPPPITLTAPAEGAKVKGSVTLSADASMLASVQFLVDGNPIGSSIQTTSPYTFNWDTSTVVDGEHWLAARTTDSQGRTNTSAVTAATVENVVPPPPPPGGVFAIDGKVSQDGAGTQTTPPLSTTQTGDLLLAFVGSDGPAGGQTVSVSGGGLSWSLVRRANSRLGTSEVWKAVSSGVVSGLNVTSTQSSPGFDQSITVIAFAASGGVGASSSAGAATGAPRTTVTTTMDGSWVFGVGNDWDRAAARTLGANQVLQHQWVDTGTGDTYWAQSQQAPTPTLGTVVPIDDTAPTNDQWNLAAVEVLPAASPPPPPNDTTPPQVAIGEPHDGDHVSGIVAVSATASDNVGVASVQFNIDGQPLGAPDTAPPFMATWDTRTLSDGPHTITAEAKDAAGNSALSAPVTVRVDNSAPPPAVISIDKQVYKRGRGTLRTPILRTSRTDQQIVAFVAYDGPSAPGSQQATVTGGGLTWTLVKRSNTQAGDAEIWTARAPDKLTRAVVTATPLAAGYDGLVTVMAYRNAAGAGIAGATGATGGEPDIYLPGVPMGSGSSRSRTTGSGRSHRSRSPVR
jgi:hypothetical protein